MSWIEQGRQKHGYFGHGTSGQGSTQLRGGAPYYNLPGRPMANGKLFDGTAMNAAMLHVPLGTKVHVVSMDDPSKSIDVTETDRGPYAAGRVIDLTPKAFSTLFGSTKKGVSSVLVVISSQHVP